MTEAYLERHVRDTKPFVIARDLDLGYEVKAQYDRDADWYILTVDGEAIECAETIHGARQGALGWLEDMRRG